LGKLQKPFVEMHPFPAQNACGSMAKEKIIKDFLANTFKVICSF
jgi:hypothetical protein